MKSFVKIFNSCVMHEANKFITSHYLLPIEVPQLKRFILAPIGLHSVGDCPAIVNERPECSSELHRV